MSVNLAEIRAYARSVDAPEAQVLRMATEEAFLRRAALVDGPFVLKGSYLTRQYLAEGWRRIPGDLDWVGLGHVDGTQLTSWATEVTELDLDDGVRFRNFSENAFWRMIDYAMHDDFPTVDTDLLAWVDEQPHEIHGMDVSFGLELEPPVALTYLPLSGEPFALRWTCALDQQIAWKLHQCLVRPRFKDILDLVLLLEENRPNIDVTWRILAAECHRDSTPLARFNWLLDGALERHPCWQERWLSHCTVEEYFGAWRNASSLIHERCTSEPALACIYRGGATLPTSLSGFPTLFAQRLKQAGFHRA